MSRPNATLLEPLADEGVQRVDFVTHSLGGVVVRSTLARDASWRELAPLWALTGEDTARARVFAALLAPTGRRDWLCACTLQGESITRVALHAALAPEDATSVESCGRELGLELAPYYALRVIQERHHFISYQRWDDRPRLTVYMAPETRP